ncbi:MAG: hypothetical protein NC411_09890 [Bacteroides sp.]|nr:hypothetical protein [Bacteroides sp.]
MNIDELKNNWNSLKFSPDCHSDGRQSDILSMVERGGLTTLRDRLGNINFRLTVICVVGIMLMIPNFKESVLLGVLSIAFFIFMGLMHFLNYRRVSRLNFSEMTVRDAILAVSDIERSRVRLRAIGMTLGFPLVVFMSITYSESYGEYYLGGCIAGALIGLAFGLLINHRAVTILREMRSQLSQE